MRLVLGYQGLETIASGVIQKEDSLFTDKCYSDVFSTLTLIVEKEDKAKEPIKLVRRYKKEYLVSFILRHIKSRY